MLDATNIKGRLGKLLIGEVAKSSSDGVCLRMKIDGIFIGRVFGLKWVGTLLIDSHRNDSILIYDGGRKPRAR